MQIHYCYTCNKRVEDDDTVTLDDKVYCRACAAKVPAADDDLPLGRATPTRGVQRRTPANKTPAKPGTNSPGRGSQTPPARSSKTNIRPATPAKGVSTRPGLSRASGGNAIPMRASGGNAIPPRASGANAIPPRVSSTNITPARASGAARRPSGGNPTLSSADKSAGRASANDEGAQQHNESRKPRGNNTLIWVLAAVAMLLAGVGAALLVGGNSITSPPPSTQPK